MILYYEMCQILLKNTTAILFEVWPLLQIAAILLQNATVITKCDVYYKSWQYNEPASLTYRFYQFY